MPRYIESVGYAPFPSGAQMVIYCTYDKNNSALVSRHRYVVAQNNNLSDKINIKCTGMTDPAAYGYYIDFVCMTHGGAAKAAYSSPALEYGENGLEFDIPNCLTQYEGYVDAQLVIYEKSRESVVAKSVGRTGGIFEVAASLNALETRVEEPANMLTELSFAVLTANNLNTEVAKTVEEARVVKADIENTLTDLDERFTAQVTSKMGELMKTLPVVTVNFYFYDRRVSSCTLVQGSKVPVPTGVKFPSGYVLESWYSTDLGRPWDFETDVVGDKDVVLYANGINDTYVTVSPDGTLTADADRLVSVYLPFEHNGVKIKKVVQTNRTSTGGIMYVNDSDYVFVNPMNRLYTVSFANTRYIGGESLVSKNWCLKAPNYSRYVITMDFEKATSYDFVYEGYLEVYKAIVKGDAPYNLRGITENNRLLRVVEFTGTVTNDCNLGDCVNLQAVIVNSTSPEMCFRPGFTSQYEGCKVYAPSDHINILYKSGWTEEEVRPLSEYTGLDYENLIP